MINYLEVNLDNILKNIQNLREVSKNTSFNAVVKANAYGLGAVEISRFIEPYVDYLSVANVQEAIELRRSGIKKGILILGYVSPQEFQYLSEYDLDVTIYDIVIAEALEDYANQIGKKIRAHLKLDTGHGRLGFKANSSTYPMMKKLFEFSHLEIIGVFSHFSTADEEDTKFTTGQYEDFEKYVQHLVNVGCRFDYIHISNDAGFIAHGYTLNMVRSGISMYGYYPSNYVKKQNKVELFPSIRLISQVSHVKWIDVGDSLSYGRAFVAKQRTKVATISIGYADGYSRMLSNKFYVLIKDQKCPILGNICMDQLMVDVSNLDSIGIGDEVIIYGKDVRNEIDIDDVAAILGTINYEVLTSIGRRVPRIYLSQGKIFGNVDYLNY